MGVVVVQRVEVGAVDQRRTVGREAVREADRSRRAGGLGLGDGVEHKRHLGHRERGEATAQRVENVELGRGDDARGHIIELGGEAGGAFCGGHGIVL
jgi:hypothetical protein